MRLGVIVVASVFVLAAPLEAAADVVGDLEPQPISSHVFALGNKNYATVATSSELGHSPSFKIKAKKSKQTSQTRSGASDAQTVSPYTPYSVPCPNWDLVRPATGLNDGEREWIEEHDVFTSKRLTRWLQGSSLKDFDILEFMDQNIKPIRIGLAFSGGGFRAMLTGAGELAALDERTDNSLGPSKLGGLLQASSYLTGLSGGAWLVGSVVANNWSSVQQMQNTPGVWELREPFISAGAGFKQQVQYWTEALTDISDKAAQGFNTSLTDIWGRALGAELFISDSYARGAHWSDVQKYAAFVQHDMPFPILLADSRNPDEAIVSLNSTVYEITPYEIGSWDPTANSFADLRYLGSKLKNGHPITSTCVNGYDNIGFLIATSSSLFNTLLEGLHFGGGILQSIERSLENTLGIKNEDIAIIGPNPFAGVPSVPPSLECSSYMGLVDGGEDGQNVPIQPLLERSREVDLILAFDSSDDTSPSAPLGGNWPNGTSIVETYMRQFQSTGYGTAFPYVPGQDTFVAMGFNRRPVLFGCDRDNLTTLLGFEESEEERYYPPVVAYIANAPHSFLSNVSTFKLSFNDSESSELITNGYNIMTQDNGTLNANWRTCLACAIVLREQQREEQQPTDQCKACLKSYCWNGTIS